MQHPPKTTFVGIVVGSIMPRSQPLIIGIFANPDGTHETKVQVSTGSEYPYYTAEYLADKWKHIICHVWQNGNTPNWYYLQFDEQHPPSELHGWALPLVVYGSWEPVDADTPGLVRLSISEQPEDDGYLKRLDKVLERRHTEDAENSAAP